MSDDAGFKWKNRRRMVWIVALVCLGLMVYMAYSGGESSVRVAVMNTVLVVLPSVVGSYVFGAVWDDKAQ